MMQQVPLDPNAIFVEPNAFQPITLEPIPLMIGNACRQFLENRTRTLILGSISETSENLDLKFVEKDAIFPLTEALVAQVRQQWLAEDELQARFGKGAASTPYNYDGMTPEQKEILRISEIILAMVQTAGYRNDPHQKRTLQMLMSFLFTLHYPNAVVLLFAGDVTHKTMFIRPLRFIDVVSESEVQDVLAATGVAADMISGADSVPKSNDEILAEGNGQ